MYWFRPLIDSRGAISGAVVELTGGQGGARLRGAPARAAAQPLRGLSHIKQSGERVA
jgi:hypothetical protein